MQVHGEEVLVVTETRDWGAASNSQGTLGTTGAPRGWESLQSGVRPRPIGRTEIPHAGRDEARKLTNCHCWDFSLAVQGKTLGPPVQQPRVQALVGHPELTSRTLGSNRKRRKRPRGHRILGPPASSL